MALGRLGIHRSLLLVLLLAVSVHAPAQRVVAVGDVHGDADTLAGVLQRAGVADANRHWSGGTTVFVQIGDLLDRGDQGRKVMDLMMALEKEAPKSAGRVVALLGNHEFMNLVGDLRYVTAAGFAEYSTARSAQVRRNAYKQYFAWVKEHARKAQPEAEADWNARHPLGFVEQREAMAPKGRYGRWLRQRPALAQIGDVIFLHAGIDPALDVTSVTALNERIRSELQRFDELKNDLERREMILPFFTFQEMVAAAEGQLKAGVADPQLKAELQYLTDYPRWYGMRPDGPLWFRGYSDWPDDQNTGALTAMLARTGAHHVVVGHTVQPEHRIRERFGGQVFLIDTGISKAYTEGRPSALEIDNGKFTAIYADGRKTLLEPASPKVSTALPLRPAGR